MTSFACISIYIGYTNLEDQCYENGNIQKSTTLSLVDFRMKPLSYKIPGCILVYSYS